MEEKKFTSAGKKKLNIGKGIPEGEDLAESGLKSAIAEKLGTPSFSKALILWFFDWLTVFSASPIQFEQYKSAFERRKKSPQQTNKTT